MLNLAVFEIFQKKLENFVNVLFVRGNKLVTLLYVYAQKNLNLKIETRILYTYTYLFM